MTERDAHPDEGTIHAWLDRQLDDTSAAALEAHLQRCDECAERVAEARGLIAGASRIVASLDDPSLAALPHSTFTLQHPEPSRPVALTTRDRVRFPAFRLTPARSAIAAVLVVAVGLAIVNEREQRTSRVAGERARAPAVASAPAVVATAPLNTAPLNTAPVTPAVPPSTRLDATAGERVAAARTFARAQRETTVSADRARTEASPAAESPVAQTIAAAKVADSAVASRSADVASPSVLRGMAGGVARAAAPAPAAAGLEAPQCYRVESATGAAASWGTVALPFVLALDAPATRNSARVIAADGRESEVRAVFERRAGDSLLFTMRRIGYTGTLVVGEPGDVRAGVMRSAPATMMLSEQVVTAAPATEPRRAMRARSSAAAPAKDSSAAAAERNAAPAVPVVVRRVECAR